MDPVVFLDAIANAQCEFDQCLHKVPRAAALTLVRDSVGCSATSCEGCQDEPSCAEARSTDQDLTSICWWADGTCEETFCSPANCGGCASVELCTTTGDDATGDACLWDEDSGSCGSGVLIGRFSFDHWAELCQLGGWGRFAAGSIAAANDWFMTPFAQWEARLSGKRLRVRDKQSGLWTQGSYTISGFEEQGCGMRVRMGDSQLVLSTGPSPGDGSYDRCAGLCITRSGFDCDGNGHRDGEGVFCGYAADEMGCDGGPVTPSFGSNWFFKGHPGGGNAEFCYDESGFFEVWAL